MYYKMCRMYEKRYGFYESLKKRGTIELQAGFALESAWMTNLLEENETELRLEGNQVILDLKPFQIITVRLKRVMS